MFRKNDLNDLKNKVTGFSELVTLCLVQKESVREMPRSRMPR